jgi:hypothetical protein
MSSSVLSQLALDDVVDGPSPDLTSIPHSRASKEPRANQSLHVVILPFQGQRHPQQVDHYSGLTSLSGCPHSLPQARTSPRRISSIRVT